MEDEQSKALECLLKRNPNPLEEDTVKELLQRHLESQHWQVTVKRGQTKGIDVEAKKASERWVIEAKGWGKGSEQQQGNYFLTALGELLQRMERDDTKYSLAFPDIPRYRALWDRLPSFAKRRTGISCLFVDSEAQVVEVQ
ncbi:MAG: hypothetical protein ABSB82_16855 [Terriglobia bacterium]